MKEIQTTHNIDGVIASDEWYTPIEFINALGHFDTDPASPLTPKWCTADVMYTKADDGLKQEWKGRVWLNPPYSAPLITGFVKKMAEHGDGIALLMPKFGSVMFREYVYPKCDGIYILKKRLKFYDMNWVQQKSPVSTSILVAYGEKNIEAILESGIEGNMLYTKK
jgi:hypothetical protein